jgi:hypothetical protein
LPTVSFRTGKESGDDPIFSNVTGFLQWGHFGIIFRLGLKHLLAADCAVLSVSVHG